LQEQLSENKKQRQVIEEIAGQKKQKKHDAETAKNRETLKSGGSTKKKKRKGDEVEDQERTPKKKRSKKKKPVEVETDVLETCVIFRHTSDKQGEVKVKVEWGDSGTKDWHFLYAMWADYPTELIEYKKKNQTATRGKIWNVLTIDNVTYFVRILCMIGGEEKIEDATFIVLANNGYKFDGEDCVKYDELQTMIRTYLKPFLTHPRLMMQA
jgi:hypothetical protein